MNKQRSTLQASEDQRTDTELVQSLCEGDESALETAIELYGGQVFALCKRICVDEIEANSVVSEVFWELWRNASLFQSRRGTLRSYLMTMARSRALDRYRSAMSYRRQQSLYAESSQHLVAHCISKDAPEDQPIQAEKLQEVKTALERLPHLQRQTLLLAFFDGMTHREVSEQMGLPLGSVKTHIRSGLLKLKHYLAAFRETQENS